MNTEKFMLFSPAEDGRDFFIKDRWKRKFHFKIYSLPVPTGLATEAMEITKDGSQGYEFSILSDFDTDVDAAEKKLEKKVIDGINKRYLSKNGKYFKMGAKDMLRGRIGYNENYYDSVHERMLVIDGKRVTIEQFAKLLEPYEGWQFEFKIIDKSEDF